MMSAWLNKLQDSGLTEFNFNLPTNLLHFNRVNLNIYFSTKISIIFLNLNCLL